MDTLDFDMANTNEEEGEKKTVADVKTKGKEPESPC